MSFLPIAILAYALNAGSIIIDKILIQKSIPNPLIYTFYISVLQLLVVLLIPFGFSLPSLTIINLSIISGIVFVGALYSFFQALKYNQASVAGPVVGALNPMFAFLIGGVILNQQITEVQTLAVFVLIAGAFVVNGTLLEHQLEFSKEIGWMILAGFLFGLSYVILREVFLQTTFINGLILTRIAGGVFALSFLLSPSFFKEVFMRKKEEKKQSKKIMFHLALGQIMGGVSSLLIVFAISLASPALVNSLFAVQYLVIMIVAILLYKKHPHLLEEKISTSIITQKLAGAFIISFGLYLLTL